MKTCKCGKVFELKWPAQRYCSLDCAMLAMRRSVETYRAKKKEQKKPE